MLLTELFDSSNQSPIEFDFGTANYANNSDELTYRVTNLPVESSFGDALIKNAGTVVLDVGTEDFVQKVSAKSEEQIASIDNVRLGRPLQNFTCETSCSSEAFNMTSNYILTVNFTTTDGENGTVQVTFDESTFKPSEEFVNHYEKLTSHA